MIPTTLRKAFTLVEMLAVMAIIVLLVALIVPAFDAITGANSITSSADRVAAAFDLARQSAMTENKTVEIRFYDISSAGLPTDYRGFQVIKISESGSAIPITKPIVLGTPTIISRDTGLSTLLDSSRNKTWTTADPQFSLPGAGNTYACRQFRFRPDGSTDLPTDKKWHVTIVDTRRTGSATQPPKNFAVVWIDPVTGRTKVLRP